MHPIIGIIDDNSDECRFYITLFRAQGYTVLTLAPNHAPPIPNGVQRVPKTVLHPWRDDHGALQRMLDQGDIPILHIRTHS